jgi:hypothetical protein
VSAVDERQWRTARNYLSWHPEFLFLDAMRFFDRVTRFIFLSMVILCGTGCVSKGGAGVTREAVTGIGKGERILIVLDEYREQGGDSIATPQLETGVEHCVRMGMLSKDRRLVFVSPTEGRKALYPAYSFELAPRKTDEILLSLQHEETARHYAELAIRYVVIVSVNIAKDKIEMGGEGGCGKDVCVGYVDVTKATHSGYSATMVDVKTGRIAGRGYATDNARSGGGVAMLFILPIPFAYVGAPGAIACRELGSGLAGLMLQ